jgi:PPK2 family polyphosphate:nucleotide phosphotransferase
MADDRIERMRQLADRLRIKAGSRVSLPGDHDPGDTAHFGQKEDADEAIQEGVDLLAEYQEKLAAANSTGLLVLFQGMDAAGKDGTIRHVLSGVNPQGVEVTSFKVPSPEEIDHDYLWRSVRRLPGRGTIGIFNRSYYEEVLVVRVHPQILAGQHLPASATGKDVWDRRFREINDWERYLVDNGFRIVKLFLNISRDEQKQRFLDRIDEPNSNWKFSSGDVRERESWDAYQAAYADMLSNTSTDAAPWHVIPADHKWFMRVAASAVIVDALADIDPQYPVATDEEKAAMAQAKAELLAEH